MTRPLQLDELGTGQLGGQVTGDNLEEVEVVPPRHDGRLRRDPAEVDVEILLVHVVAGRELETEGIRLHGAQEGARCVVGAGSQPGGHVQLGRLLDVARVADVEQQVAQIRRDMAAFAERRGESG